MLIYELEGAFGATTTAPRLITVEAVSVHDFLPQFVELELQVSYLLCVSFSHTTICS